MSLFLWANGRFSLNPNAAFPSSDNWSLCVFFCFGFFSPEASPPPLFPDVPIALRVEPLLKVKTFPVLGAGRCRSL